MAASASFDLKKIARLARLELSEAEIAEYSGQLEQILDYVRKLEALDTTGIDPTAHTLPVCNALRPDVSRPGLDVEAVLANAPKRLGSQFLVPKVVE